jgi:hypothetical protein
VGYDGFLYDDLNHLRAYYIKAIFRNNGRGIEFKEAINAQQKICDRI